MDKYEVLKHCFGHSRFRQGQEELVDAVLSGRDALGIMPTGGGQIPVLPDPRAASAGGITLVISPLISLMKDQVAALQQRGDQRRVHQQLASPPSSYRRCAPRPARGRGHTSCCMSRRNGWKRRASPHSCTAVTESRSWPWTRRTASPSGGRTSGQATWSIPDFVCLALPQRPPVDGASPPPPQREVQRGHRPSAWNCDEPVRCVTGFRPPEPLLRRAAARKTKCPALLDLPADAARTRQASSTAPRAPPPKRVCRTLCSARRRRGLLSRRAGGRRAPPQARTTSSSTAKSVIVATNAFGMGIDKSNVNFVDPLQHAQEPRGVLPGGRARRTRRLRGCRLRSALLRGRCG